MRLGMAARVREGERRIEQASAISAAAHRLGQDEPAQMRKACPQILSIDGDRAEDVVAGGQRPDRVGGPVQSPAEGGEPRRDDGLEGLAEPARFGVMTRVQRRHRADEARPVARQNGRCWGARHSVAAKRESLPLARPSAGDRPPPRPSVARPLISVQQGTFRAVFPNVNLNAT